MGLSPPLLIRHSLRETRKALCILLAEDDLVNRTVATHVMEKHGYSADLAANGRAALDKLRTGEFDLVLMDVEMPNMNGFEVTAQIRQEERTSVKHIPSVARTADVLKGDRERCLAAAMNDYICKPITGRGPARRDPRLCP